MAVAVLHRALDRHRLAADGQLEARAERRRTKRHAERDVRLEVVARGILPRRPVRRREVRACRHLHVGLARDRLRERAGARRRRPAVEPGEPRLAQLRALPCIRGRIEGNAHRLTRRHHAVVGQRVDAHRRGDQQRVLELPLLLREAQIDFVARAVAEPEGRQPAADVAHVPQAGDERRDRAERSLRRHALDRGADVAREAGQQRPQRFGRRGAGKPGETVQADVDAGEEIRGRGGVAIDERVLQAVGPRLRLAGEQQQLRRALALVHRPRLEPDLGIRAPERRVEAGDLRRHHVGRARRRLRRERGFVGAEITHRLPRPQAVLDLFGILRGIGGGAKGFTRQLRRGLVMESARLPAAQETGDDVGTDRADVTHEIAEDLDVLTNGEAPIRTAIGRRIEPRAIEEVVFYELRVRVEAQGLAVDVAAFGIGADDQAGNP